MDSILTSIKKLLGIAEEYIQFDADLIIHINSVFFELTQLGVGPTEGFSISDNIATWSSYLPEGSNMEAVKSFMYLKVKLLFDPPLSSAVIESTNRQISEIQWRLRLAAEFPETGSDTE